MSERITEALLSIASDIVVLARAVLENINQQDSNLYNTITSKVVNVDLIEFMYPDYLEYIDRGRQPNVKKVPIQALVDWAKRNGIPTDNSTLFAIQHSIYINGIIAKPFFEPFQTLLDKNMQKYVDRIFEALIIEFDNAFNR